MRILFCDAEVGEAVVPFLNNAAQYAEKVKAQWCLARHNGRVYMVRDVTGFREPIPAVIITFLKEAW